MSSSFVPGEAASGRRRLELAASGHDRRRPCQARLHRLRMAAPRILLDRHDCQLAGSWPYGWVQFLNFMLTGTLVLAFGRGLAAKFQHGRRFPCRTGARAGHRSQPNCVRTLHHRLVGDVQPNHHGRRRARRLRRPCLQVRANQLLPFLPTLPQRPAWHPLAGWTPISAVVLTLGIGLLRFSQQERIV